jgi:two-component system sensor histidine kinase KdpD
MPDLNPSIRQEPYQPSWRKMLLHSSMTLVVTLAASGILYVLSEVIHSLPIDLLYLMPVGLCAAIWGLDAGILAAALAFLGLNYFFIEPRFTLFVHQSQDLIVLLVFLGVAIFVSQMVGRTRNSLAAARAREQEAVRLYQLSAELAELHDDRLIVESIARHIIETFQATRVEVGLQNRDGREAFVFSLPDGAIDSALDLSQPTMQVPLETPNELIGEIRVWRPKYEWMPADVRLLQTFSYQGVIALERSRLIEAETRARVLEESDRMKTSLLSSVSHELRTPLSTIKAAATSLQSAAVSWDSDARNELLLAIDEEADHLNLLVGNLLDMSRIETGALKPEQRWNALDEVVDAVLHRMRTTLRKHRIQVDVPENLPLVYVDDVQIGQVFINLISNSLKYAPENTMIRIQARKLDQENLMVQVSNQGPPVSEGDLEKIFEKFHRVTASDRTTGIGLGLSICKGIVEAHGGRIWASNLPDGFAISFTLPLIWQGITPSIPEEHEPTATHPGDR